MPDLQHFKLDPDSEPDPRLLALLSGLIGKDDSTVSRCIDTLLSVYPNHKKLLSLYKKLPLSRVDYSKKRDILARKSAQVYFSILDQFKAKSINSCIEFGCGQGSWIGSAQNHYNINKENSIGIDGEWAKEFQPKNILFCAADMNKGDWPISSGLTSQQHFDLGICVEVLEHLDKDMALKNLDYMTGLTDMLIFGAAPPGQWGKGHINCHPQSYWASHFMLRGFEPIDCFRPLLWDKSLAEPWYVQNTFLYCKSSSINNLLRCNILEYRFIEFNMVHPFFKDCKVKKHSFQHEITGLVPKNPLGFELIEVSSEGVC